MTKHRNPEDRVECPVESCDEEPLARGLFMHVFQTDDPDEEGHWPRYETPPDFDLEEIKVAGKDEVEMNYPDTVELEDVHYLDTYTGEAYEGKRGLMIHLGQMEGRKNFPEDVTDRHEAEDFPIVEVDEDGRVTNVVKGVTDPALPALEPYLPWLDDETRGFVSKGEIQEFINKVEDSSMGAVTPEKIREELLSE